MFGGKSLAILQLHQPSSSDRGATECTADGAPSSRGYFSRIWTSPTRSDLIWDVKLLRCGESCPSRHAPATFDVAVGYAHDRVEVLLFTNESATTDAALSLRCSSDLPHVECDDRSLLYSMCLHGSCRHQLIVIGGTVFSHLLLWNASCANAADMSDDNGAPGTIVTRSVLHRIAGHAGVIFRVEASLDATRLCSVSDDRTVRVWQWKASGDDAPPSSPLPLASLLDPSLGTYVPVMEAYGHKARVWRCALLESYPLVVSSSEDNTCIVWHAQTGEVLSKWSGQKGGLWSLAVDPTRRLIATGAGDASIRVQSFDTLIKRHGMTNDETSSHDDVLSTTMNMMELLPPLPPVTEVDASCAAAAAADASPPAKKAKITSSSSDTASTGSVAAPAKAKKLVAEYCRELLLDVFDARSSRIFFVTNFGRIMQVQVREADADSEGRQKIDTTPTLMHHHTQSAAAFVVLSLSPCKSLLVVGDQRGGLLLLPTDTTSTIAPLWSAGSHLSAISFVQWVSVPGSSDYHLLTADSLGEVKAWHLSQSGDSLQLRPILTFRMPVAKARVTCGGIITTAQMKQYSNVDARDADSDDDSSDDDEMADDSSLPVPMADIDQDGASAIPDGIFFVCGDSRGSVYVFFMSSIGVAAGAASPPPVVLAVDRLMNVHEKATITSLTLGHPTAAGAKMYSTATDGRVIEYALAAGRGVRVPATDAWIEKHNQCQPTSDMPDAAASARIANWHIARKRVHKLSHLSTLKQVFFSSASADAAASSRHRDVLVSGFHSTDFVLWNLTHNTQVRRWPCGGDKRPWSFQLREARRDANEHASAEDGFFFAFERQMSPPAANDTATGEIILQSQPPTIADPTASTSSVPALACTIHGRLTTNLVAVPIQPHACLVATSSEDNTVKLYSVVTPPPASTPAGAPHTLPSIMPTRAAISCVATLIDHPDVVRAVAVTHERTSDTAVSCLLFSGGGCDFLHCSRINATLPVASDAPIGVSIESLASLGGRVFNLVGKTVQVHTEIAKERMVKQDIRIMCVAAVQTPTKWTTSERDASVGPPLHLVVTGNSLGVVKFYLFDSQRPSFRLLAECPQHAYTILSIVHLLIDDELIIFTGATDGRIMAWSVKDMVMRATSTARETDEPIALEPILRHQAHQSGVDCLSVTAVTPSSSSASRTFRLFSGGDDEAIGVLTGTLAGAHDANPIQAVWSHTWPNAHCSAVKSMTTEGDRLYSVGYDQRVRVWTLSTQQIACGFCTVQIRAAGAALLDVWDVSTIRSVPSALAPPLAASAGTSASPLLLVGGHGMQIMQLTES